MKMVIVLFGLMTIGKDNVRLPSKMGAITGIIIHPTFTQLFQAKYTHLGKIFFFENIAVGEKRLIIRNMKSHSYINLPTQK